jgi:single-stranded-DNA-specific exonuclease
LRLSQDEKALFIPNINQVIVKKNKKPLDIDFIKKWMNKGINPIILSIINRRGIFADNELLDYFSPIFENLPSPFLFSQLAAAFERIDSAIKNNEKIIIYGDRDVDGTTSIAILVKFLKKNGADVVWDLPVNDEPYGLFKQKVSSWKDRYSLCITVDCGITNINEIDDMKSMSIDTIIIDHHKPLDNVPKAISIVNPKLEKNFEFNDISACGVVFLFIYGYLIYKSGLFDRSFGIAYYSYGSLYFDIYRNFLKVKETKIGGIEEVLAFSCDEYFFFKEGEYQNIVNCDKLTVIEIQTKSFLNLVDDVSLKAYLTLSGILLKRIGGLDYIKENFLSLVMLGTIADIMPLIKTNRIFTRLGLLYLENNQAIIELFKHNNIDHTLITSKDLSWTICPLLNASGRMGNAKLTVEYLLTGDNKLIEKMIENNNMRKIKGDQAYNNFIDKVEENKNLYNRNLAFFYSDEIHRGVTGITANKLSHETNCPTIVAKLDGDYITGSIRGNNTDYHFVDFLDKAQHLLEEYGGHHQAAGFRLHKDNLEDFKDFLKMNSGLFSMSEIGEEKIEIDAEIPFEYLNYDLFKIVNFFEPIGNKNESPVFFTPSLEILEYSKMGKDKQHLKIIFDASPKTFVAVYWNKAEYFEELYKTTDKVDVIYQVEINKFNNQYIPQMLIMHMTKPGDN